jgi:hypothetical protein
MPKAGKRSLKSQFANAVRGAIMVGMINAGVGIQNQQKEIEDQIASQLKKNLNTTLTLNPEELLDKSINEPISEEDLHTIPDNDELNSPHEEESQYSSQDELQDEKAGEQDPAYQKYLNNHNKKSDDLAKTGVGTRGPRSYSDWKNNKNQDAQGLTPEEELQQEKERQKQTQDENQKENDKKESEEKEEKQPTEPAKKPRGPASRWGDKEWQQMNDSLAESEKKHEDSDDPNQEKTSSNSENQQIPAEKQNENQSEANDPQNQENESFQDQNEGVDETNKDTKTPRSKKTDAPTSRWGPQQKSFSKSDKKREAEENHSKMMNKQNQNSESQQSPVEEQNQNPNESEASDPQNQESEPFQDQSGEADDDQEKEQNPMQKLANTMMGNGVGSDSEAQTDGEKKESPKEDGEKDEEEEEEEEVKKEKEKSGLTQQFNKRIRNKGQISKVKSILDKIEKGRQKMEKKKKELEDKIKPQKKKIDRKKWIVRGILGLRILMFIVAVFCVIIVIGIPLALILWGWQGGLHFFSILEKEKIKKLEKEIESETNQIKKLEEKIKKIEKEEKKRIRELHNLENQGLLSRNKK